jgi:hypothetical protein
MCHGEDVEQLFRYRPLVAWPGCVTSRRYITRDGFDSPQVLINGIETTNPGGISTRDCFDNRLISHFTPARAEEQRGWRPGHKAGPSRG